MDEQSIFLEALRKPNADAQAAWLDEACGEDEALKQRLIKMLQKHERARSFLERPAAGLEQTLLFDAFRNNLPASLEAGLAPAFGDDAAVVIGGANHSVLRSIGNTIDEVPHVSLHESNAEGDGPIARPQSPEIPNPKSESRYQLQGEIARGGMGAIIKGRDTDLGRDLAIKVLLDSQKDKPDVVRRFVEEAQIGGQLQHPGIAPVYELGQFADQRPFISMKLVKGETLAKLLADREAPETDRGRFLGIFEQVCQTMAYAHLRGVIHRDLKPANIMVGSFGEVQVMDWGLAKVLSVGGVADEKKARDRQQGQSVIQTLRSGLGSDSPGDVGAVGSQTQMGSVMGTPAYMPPEQALGEIDQLDERSDVFGLGAILCEILTGAPPYVGDDGTQIFRLASRGKLDPCYQRLDECGADGELVAVAKHCLDLEPAARPRNAGELAECVTAYIESVEVKLRESELKRATQTARADAEAAQAKAERQRAEAEAARALEENRRRKASLALAATIILLVVLGSGGWLYTERQNANRNADHAAEMEVLANQEKAARDEAERQLYAHRINASHVAWETGDLARFSNLLDLSAAGQVSPGFEWQVLNEFRKQQVPQADYSTPSGLNCFAIDRRRRRIAVGLENGEILLRGLENEWSDSILQDEDESTRWSEVTSLAFSADGRLFATGGRPKALGELRIWDLSSARQTTIDVSRQASVSAAAFCPNGDWAATYTEDDRLQVWDCNSEKPKPLWDKKAVFGRQSQNTRRCRLAISPSNDRPLVACSTWNGTIKLWDLRTGKQLEGLLLGTTVFGIAFSPGGDRLATASDREVRIWNVSGAKPTKRQKVTWERCENVEFSTDGTKLVTAARNDGQLVVWDLDDNRRLARFLHPSVFCDASLSEDGKRLYSAGGRHVRVWDVDRSKHKISTLSAHWMVPLAVSGDSRYVAVGGPRNSIVVWDISSGKTRTIRHGTVTGERALEARVRCLDFSADGRFLYSGAIDGPDGGSTIRITNLKDDSESQVRKVAGRISCLACSPDGEHFVTAASRGELQLWNINRVQPVRLRQTPGAIVCMKFSPDGSYLAAGGDVFAWNDPESKSNIVEVWDVRGDLPTSAQEFEQANGAWALDWSADGRTLATAKTDGGLALWDLESGERVRSFNAGGWITSIGLSPDGKTLAACGPVAGVVRFWETETGNEVAAFRVREKCRKLAFLPSGDGLVLSSIEGITRLWRASPPAK